MSDIAALDLDCLYPPARPLSLKKTLDHVEKHGARFIARSPFCVVASAGPDGSMDVSPRGGVPGFVHVADPKTLLMPDRPGNNRLDTLRNLLAGPGRIGLMFMIPGIDDIYRVNGRASVTDDAALRGQFVEFGKTPHTIVRITVEEAFLHCPKALMRGGLWDAATWADRSEIPTLAEMVSDQLGLGKPTATEEETLERYKSQL
jgi:PPOX class probable FMN-dependent enzyme